MCIRDRLLTSHRLLFVPEASDEAPFFVPHATCLDVRVEAPPPGSNTDALALCVVTRDFRRFEFTSRTATNRDFHWYRSEIRWRTREDRFHRPAAAEAATRNEAAVDTAPAEAAEAVSEPPADASEKPLTKRQQRRVALKKFLKAGEGSGPSAPDAGADVDLLAEFRRQGVLDDHRWRLTETNALYALCPTYPSTLVVPAALTDAVLADAARWRSKARVPVLTWYNRASGAPICRSSQPHAGLTDKVMAEDEASLMHLRAATSRTNAGRLLADSFDDDGSGTISHQEFIQGIRKCPEPPPDTGGGADTHKRCGPLERPPLMEPKRLGFEAYPVHLALGNSLHVGVAYRTTLTIHNVGDTCQRLTVKLRGDTVKNPVRIVKRPSGPLAPGMRAKAVFEILARRPGDVNCDVIVACGYNQLEVPLSAHFERRTTTSVPLSSTSFADDDVATVRTCLLYTSPSPRD